MTVLRFMELHPDLSATYTMTPGDVNVDEVAENFVAGDVVTGRGLIDAALLPSDNEAATRLGRAIGERLGDMVDPIATAAASMTARAQALGMINTYYGNTTGLDGVNNSSTARDQCLLMRYIVRNRPDLFSYFSQATRQIPITGGRNTTIDVTHAMVATGNLNDPDIIGGKTEFTLQARANLAWVWTDASGRPVVSVTMGDSSRAQRVLSTRALVDGSKAAWTRRDGYPVKA